MNSSVRFSLEQLLSSWRLQLLISIISSLLNGERVRPEKLKKIADINVMGRSEDCSACKIIGGCGLIGMGCYVAHHSRSSAGGSKITMLAFSGGTNDSFFSSSIYVTIFTVNDNFCRTGRTGFMEAQRPDTEREKTLANYNASPYPQNRRSQ